MKEKSFFVDEGALVGKGTRIGHFSHVMGGATIGERCSLGANCTMVGGVTVGACAFVEAGSVVTKDVPAHAVVGGPTLEIKAWVCSCHSIMRFNEDAIPPGAQCTACGKLYQRRGKNVAEVTRK